MAEDSASAETLSDRLLVRDLRVLHDELLRYQDSADAALRRRARQLAPFVHELCQDLAEPFRTDLLALGTSWASVSWGSVRLLSLLRRYWFPFPHIWRVVFSDLRTSGRFDFARSHDFAGSGGGFDRITVLGEWVEVQFIPGGPEPEARDRRRLTAVLEPPAPKRAWVSIVLRPDPSLPPAQRRRIVGKQIRAAFNNAWRQARRTRSDFFARLLFYEDVLWTFADGSPPWTPHRHPTVDDLTLALNGTRCSAACGRCVRQITEVMDLVGARSRPKGGPLPEWGQVAHWWALHVFQGLSEAAIAEQEDPEDPYLADRVHQALLRLRE
jgi:hypothetical protein